MENKAITQNLKKEKFFSIKTYGCQMNENDSEKIAGMLENMGYINTENLNEADLIVVNTCSVRATADQRAFGNIGSIKTLKKKNPDLLLAICGCMMQQEENVNYIKEKHPEVDIIFGTQNLSNFPQLIANRVNTGKRVIEINQETTPIDETLPVSHKYPFKSYVTIMQGCNNFCSYCIVPYVRGRERSRKPENIIEEVKELVKNGTLEVTLLGQNVNSYGNDFEDKNINFSFLLNELNKVEGLKRIRFMSSNPKDFTDELLQTLKNNDKVMPALHLALQSGSTKILKKMNRHYTKEEAIALIKQIKETIPEISITTDIIVGFPGETEEDFQDTVDLLRECQFDNAFTFIYSKRNGTVAAEMPNQVDEKIKHERISILLDILKEQAQHINDKFQNQILDVLVEEVSQKDNTKVSGRSPSGKLVHLTGGEELIGKIIPVKITEVGPYSLIGELVEDNNGTYTHDATVS